MVKLKTGKRTHYKTDLQNLSEKDRDYLTLKTSETMKKYKVGKQSVYDRKFALNKKMRAAGLTIEKLLNTKGPKAVITVNQAAAKKISKKTVKKPKQEAPKREERSPEPVRDIVKYEKAVPVILKPVEINFGNFSVKLNGVPKSISVNPDTNAIEIDI